MKTLFALLILCASLHGEVIMSYPFEISTPGLDSFEPKIAMNDSGDAVIAFRTAQSLGVNVIQAMTVSLSQQKWSKASTLSKSGENAIVDDVAIDSSSNALVVWESGGPWHLGEKIGSAFYKSSIDKWSQPINLSLSEKGASSAIVSMNAKGDALVMWNNSHTVNFDSRRYDPETGKWSPIMPVVGFVGQQIVLDDEGNATALWTNYEFLIKTAYLKKNEQWWSYPEQVSGPSCSAPSIAMNRSRFGVALWSYSFTNKNNNIMSQIHGVIFDGKTQKWHTKFDLTPTRTSDSFYSPQVVVNESGDAIGVWQAEGLFPFIAGAFYDASLKKWNTFEYITPFFQSGKNPSAAIDKKGNAVVVFSNIRESGLVVQMVVYDALSKAWSEPFDLSAVQQPSFPLNCHVAMTPDGQIIVVWNELHDKIRHRVMASVGQLNL